MNASIVGRPRSTARRALGALSMLLVLLAATTTAVRADLLPQAITFTSTAPAGATVGGATYAPTATADSGLPVTFSVDAGSSGVCEIAAGIVSFVGIGTCTILADQAGNETYAPAPQVPQSFTVTAAGPAGQTITFGAAPTGVVVGGTGFSVSATASSGLAVTYSSTTTAICTVGATTGALTLLAAGLCTIAADQAGDGVTWAPAPQVTQSFTVAASLTPQAITFGPLANRTLAESPVTVSATATSSLPVTFGSTTTAVCTVAGTSVTLLATGTCSITADQAGNGTWAAAPQVTQSFLVGATVTPPPGTLPTLVVAADPKSRPFGLPNPALTATISGFVSGQTLATSGITGSPACTTTATLASPAGTYPITCTLGTLTSAAYLFAFAPGTLTVVRGTSSVTLSTTTTVFETSTPVIYTATVEPAAPGAIPFGSLVFVIDGAAQPAVPLDAGGRGSVTVTWATPGVKSVDVSYTGGGSFAAAGSASAAPTVVANTARATRVGVLGATFYPIVDGWRDTVTARGTRLEPLAVKITVRNLFGGVVRTFALPTASGPYAWAWDGRRANGTALPAGSYTIEQALTDPYGTHPRTVTTSGVAISLRKISWARVIVAARPGPRCFQFTTGNGVGAYSCGSRGVLRLGGNAGQWPGVGYEFRLPAANGYRSIRIELQGTATGRRPTVGLQDWTLGSSWGQLYRSGWRRTAISPTATGWSGVKVADLGSVISGRAVRLYVDGGGRLAGPFALELAGIRLVVSVGTLQ